LNYELFYF